MRVAAAEWNRQRAVQRTPVFRRDEPAAAAGQLCTGTTGDGAEGVKGD
jgi:hypothetical protein